MSLEQRIIDLYVRFFRPLFPRFIRDFLRRIRLLWGYRPIWRIRRFTAGQKAEIIRRFIRIDFGIEHAHRPCEMAHICKFLTERSAQEGEIMLEAGCWKGGSTAKFSIICKLMGYRLYVYDSFQGIESTGSYAAGQAEVEKNIREFGEIDVCHFFPGWFSETLAGRPLPSVRAVYIDCDIVKGTYETLQSVIPALVSDGMIFSQDYHITVVREYLHDPETWRQLDCDMPNIEFLCHNLAKLHFS